MMDRQRFFWMSMAAVLALALSARATTIVHMNMEELTNSAQLVARGKCVASEARMDGGMIWTFTTFEVSETLKGNAARQITVRLLGGKVGHMKSTVDGVPQFRPGEEVFLFLEPTREGDLSVTAWVQGTFRVRADPQTGKESVTQDSAAFATFDPATRQFKSSGVRNMPIETFRLRVREAVERQRTGRQP
jgi:hypothetical protein